MREAKGKKSEPQIQSGGESQRGWSAIGTTFAGERWLFETENGTQHDRSYISHVIERQSKRAIGKMVGAHALRHSAATVLISRTNKAQAVSEYLGHSDPATTLRFYVHESLTDADLRNLEIGDSKDS